MRSRSQNYFSGRALSPCELGDISTVKSAMLICTHRGATEFRPGPGAFLKAYARYISAHSRPVRLTDIGGLSRIAPLARDGWPVVR